MKKKLLIAAAVAATALMTGCGHEHTFVEVSCEQPLTCECGETEGEIVGHDYTEATCTEAKTCTKCGNVDGEPLGHQLTEANYQDAPVCTVCGATEGEKLEADFEKYGFVSNIKVGEEYEQPTCCYDDVTVETIGTAIVDVLECADEIDELPKKDGYVWVKVHQSIDYTDDNAWNYGYMALTSSEDYYNIKAHDDSVVECEDTADVPEYAQKMDDYYTFTVNWHGEDYECEHITVFDNGGWVGNKHAHYGNTYYYHIPEGYDGIVVSTLYKSSEDMWGEGMYINDVADENAHFLRIETN